MASDSEEIEYLALSSAPFSSSNNQKRRGSSDDDDDDGENDLYAHEEEGFLVHMSHDDNKSQWNHVDDLDKFFTSVYDYHQRHGFQNMVLMEVLQLLQFVFIVLFATYLTWCVNYPELFDEVPHKNASHKKTISDITYSVGQCSSRISFFSWLLLFFCSLFFIGRSIKMALNFCNYLRTRNFFISALNTETRDLSNMTWHEVQIRLLEVQKEQQICIHKQELTELDIYHRILRFKNYLVAMVNKELLPLKFKLPFIGEHALLTHGMRFNLDILLYWSPWSIFVNSYTMREDYKSNIKRRQLSDQLSTHIVLLALLNFVLSPFIFFYQIIYFFFRYAEFVKRSPSFLGSRQWANYGRLYLRHFNELDHELVARLNRAYIPSNMYMRSFTSASLIIIAKYVAFFAGAPAAVLFVLGILDFNDVTKVEHLFTVASVCGMVATVFSGLIPDENEVFCPERLMMSILAQIHYMPGHWKGRAHTSNVRDEFSMLFQYKVVYILEELFSPLFTPLWLFFCLRPKSLQIVDFFRCFTVEVAGVGDVCSFAQMDIKKHGNQQWMTAGGGSSGDTKVPKAQQGEHGKIELSLMHFTSTNPEWKPPRESNNFVTGVKEEVQKELPALTSIIADPISLPSLGYVNPLPSFYHMGASQYQGSYYQQPTESHQHHQAAMAGSHAQNPMMLTSSACMTSSNSLAGARLKGALSGLDAPVVNNSQHQPTTLTTSAGVSGGSGQGMMVSSTTGSFYSTDFFNNLSIVDESQRELLSGNMSLSVLHLYETQHRRRYGGVGGVVLGGQGVVDPIARLRHPGPSHGGQPGPSYHGGSSFIRQPETTTSVYDTACNKSPKTGRKKSHQQPLLLSSSSSSSGSSNNFGPLTMDYQASSDVAATARDDSFTRGSNMPPLSEQQQWHAQAPYAFNTGRGMLSDPQHKPLGGVPTGTEDNSQCLGDNFHQYNSSSLLDSDSLGSSESHLHPLAERFHHQRTGSDQQSEGVPSQDSPGGAGLSAGGAVQGSASTTGRVTAAVTPPIIGGPPRPLMPQIEEDMSGEQELDTTTLRNT